MADFQDDFTHIGVRIDYTRRAGDLEEDLDKAEYKDIDDAWSVTLRRSRSSFLC